jgi:RNA polymerase sigma-70 factor (ECF subfamily)
MNSRAKFMSTHWSVVLNAGADDSTVANAALQQLCSTYWYPLYAFVRRQGFSPHDAQDVTQSFLSDLLARQSLQNVSPAKGKFRSFLLASLKHFVANERNHANRLKRGGGALVFSLDETAAEDRYRHEPVDGCAPDKLYDRRWALTTLEAAMTRLGEECDRDGKNALFGELKSTLTGERALGGYAETAQRLNMSEDAIKQAARRLRLRFAEHLREIVAQTVADPAQVEDEMRSLAAAIK